LSRRHKLVPLGVGSDPTGPVRPDLPPPGPRDLAPATRAARRPPVGPIRSLSAVAGCRAIAGAARSRIPGFARRSLESA